MNDWEPIETAPKDGNGILVWISNWHTCQVVFWKEGQWWMPIGPDGLMGLRKPEFTHWMPLPQRPTQPPV